MSNRLTIKGQVTIPKAVRDFLGLQEGGSSVEFTINDDGSVTVRKACAAAEHTTAESVQTASASPVRSRLQRPTRGFQRFRSPRSFTLRRVGTARRRYLIGCPSEWVRAVPAAKAECCRLTF